MPKIRRYLSAELKDGESVLHVIRETALKIFPRIFFGAVFYIILFFFSFTLIALGAIGIAAFAILFVLGAYAIGKKIFYWHRNAFIITDRRIIDIEQKGWFTKHISEIPHHKIDNVSHRIRGFFHTIFRCGDIFVQSRGGTTNLMMKNVPRPSRAQSFLNEVLEKVEEKW